MKFDSEEAIKQNNRFYTAKVVKDGKPYFYKKSQAKEFDPQIIKQVNGAKLLSNTLNQMEINWLNIENITEYGADWLIAEWVEGQQLAVANDYQKGQNLSSLLRLLDVQVVMDKAAGYTLSDKPLRIGGKTMIAEAEQKLAEKLLPIVKEQKIDNKLIDDATLYFIQCSNEFTPCIQHADLTPWHLYSNSQSVTVIDCEHVNNDWPRFYDIANFYSALQTRFDLKPQAEAMIDGFSIRRQVDLTNEKGFLGIVVMRNLLRIVEHNSDADVVNRCVSSTKEIISR